MAEFENQIAAIMRTGYPQIHADNPASYNYSASGTNGETPAGSYGTAPTGPGPNGSWSHDADGYDYNGDSGKPWLATNWFSTLTAAEANWSQLYGSQYAPVAPPVAPVGVYQPVPIAPVATPAAASPTAPVFSFADLLALDHGNDVANVTVPGAPSLNSVLGPSENIVLGASSPTQVASNAQSLANAVDPNPTGLLATFNQSAAGGSNGTGTNMPLGTQTSLVDSVSPTSTTTSGVNGTYIFLALAIAAAAAFFYFHHKHTVS